jgi:hypothetical protein
LGGASPLDRYRARFDAETRDSDWAAPAEMRALALFTLVDGIRSIEVHCAATLCRVEGVVPPGAMKRAMAGIHGVTLRDRLGGGGLKIVAVDFRPSNRAGETGGFTAFLHRVG